MYVLKNAKRNAYLTYDGWTTITYDKKNGVLNGLNNVIRFTAGEAKHPLPDGDKFVYFPVRKWSDYK